MSRRVARVVVSRRTGEVSGHGPGGVTWWHPRRRGRRACIAGMPAHGRLESKVLAQRGAFIVRTEQAAPLQHRDHHLDEIVAPTRQVRRRDVEPVARPLLEPGLHHVSDLLGGVTMRNTTRLTRENRTITVDFRSEATYFQLLGDGKAFVECVLAFVLSLGLQLKHKAICSGGGCLTRHSHYARVGKSDRFLPRAWIGRVCLRCG
jgi:hypothetical protein